MTSGTPRPQIDTSRPHPARLYDYYLGGKDNYPVDRELAEKLAKGAQRGAQINREFMHRAVAWAAGSGADQFLDIGTGIPTRPNLHQIVQAIVPAARIVYADNDPIVLRHAEALLVSTPEGATAYVETDVRRPADILEEARRLLDFERPVVLSLVALLHFLGDDDDPYKVVRTLVDALPPGSLLVISHGTADFLDPEQAAKVTSTYRSGGITLRPRTRAEVARFFEGLDLVDPGLVRAPEWYKDTPAPANEESGFYVGVARVR
ncbi:SAM-dependent methyltransferase [Streptomyces sp. NBC_01498]|uniref:SAM-dependent methyltransferase n=1 Tax=Streptomyces sp. NBC_01498 TaxID=2975870 RepID=UPI002E7BE2FB|nr:SAM-dependent methyltransferase [Streptomyces sp. NBC_01498]WTL23317.1 SAM-dependent methyltransferase [Streptomyces sp. NBC_01498]